MAAGDGVAGHDALDVIVAVAGVDEEADGIGGVAGGGHDLDLRGDAVDDDALAVGKRLHAVGAVALVERPNGGTGELTETLRAVGVVAVAVGQQNQGDIAGVAVQDVEVPLVLRPGVDDDAAIVAFGLDDVGVCLLYTSDAADE